MVIVFYLYLLVYAALNLSIYFDRVVWNVFSSEALMYCLFK